MNKYDIAKNILNLLSIFGWLIVGLGPVVFLFTFNDSIQNALIFVGVAAVVGFINIAIAQMGLAQIDTAENTYELKQLFKEHLTQFAVNTARTVSSDDRSEPNEFSSETVKFYKGVEIKRGTGKREFFVGDVKVMGVIAAEKYIDNLIKSE